MEEESEFSRFGTAVGGDSLGASKLRTGGVNNNVAGVYGVA